MFVTIGGLGDSRLSLSPWHEQLTAKGISFRHIDVAVTGKTGFKHRLEALNSAIREADEPVCLIGQSAGGLAVLLAGAEDNNQKVAGVIAVSPATPRGICPLGIPLIKVMWRYEIAITLSKSILVRPEDYDWLISGDKMEPGIRNKLVFGRQDISGRESMELSTPWLQPTLTQVRVPTVLVCGTEDRWVNPKAHRKLFEKIKKGNNQTILISVPFAGHLPAHGNTRAVVQALGHLPQ